MSLTAEQHDLRDAVRGLLASADGQGGAVWGRLCWEVGVAGLAIPERYSGAGGGAAQHTAAIAASLIG